MLIFIVLACVDTRRMGGWVGQSADIYPVCLWLRWSGQDRPSFVLFFSVDLHPAMMEIARDKLATYVE